MTSKLPLACSLEGAEARERLLQISAVGEAGLLAVEADTASATLRFRPEVRERVQAIVAAEAECCPFFSLDLAEEPGSVRLTIAAPAGAEPVLHDLVAAFRGRSAR
jgi:hypothetical protein